MGVVCVSVSTTHLPWLSQVSTHTDLMDALDHILQFKSVADSFTGEEVVSAFPESLVLLLLHLPYLSLLHIQLCYAGFHPTPGSYYRLTCLVVHRLESW